MRAKRLLVLVIGASAVSFAAPSTFLPFIQSKSNPDQVAISQSGGLTARKAKADAKRYETNYLDQTQKAIMEQLRAEGAQDFKVSEVVFTSEKIKRIAGQKQVTLTFTYQVYYKNAIAKRSTGKIQLVSDADGNWFDTSVKL